MKQKEIIEIIQTKDVWESTELVDLIKEKDKNKVLIKFYHIGGAELLRDGTQLDVCRSLKEVHFLLEDLEIEYDETITDVYKLVEEIRDLWEDIHNCDGGSGWIEY